MATDAQRRAGRKYYLSHREERNEDCRRRYHRKKDDYKKTRAKWYMANREHCLEVSKTYLKNHPEARRKSEQIYKEKYPDRIRVRKIAEKKIPLSDRCEMCGGKAADRHHSDYSKPLEVMHLCESCHYGIPRKAM